MESEGRSRRRGGGSSSATTSSAASKEAAGGGGGREVAPLQAMVSQQVDAEVTHKLQALEEQRQQKLWMAQRWREVAFRNLEHTYAAQVQQAQDEYEAERQELLDRGKAKGGRPGQRGAAAANNGGAGEAAASRMVTRTASRRRTRQQASAEAESGLAGGDGGAHAQLQAKLRKLNPPLISYTLTEDEIVEDLSIICNRLSAFSNDMKRAMFQDALGAPISLPPPLLPPTSPSSSSTTSSSTSPPPPTAPTVGGGGPSAAPVGVSNVLDPYSWYGMSHEVAQGSTSPPRTSAFAHKILSPQQRDPFAALS